MKPTARAPGRGGCAPGEVRLIGGIWKRSKLPVMAHAGLRPTPDRVRETLFNWLGQDLSGWRCLDAFAGSGALGFEAASRGAASVRLVERDAGLVQALMAARERLGGQARLDIRQGDGLSALRQQTPATLDLVFLDPPYGSGLLEPALEAAVHALVPGGFAYAEADHGLAALPVGLEPYRALRAGMVHAQLLRRSHA